MKPPCKGCPDRFFDPVTKKRCHNTCEKYTRYQLECQRIRDENHEKAMFNNYKYDNVPRLKRSSPGKMFRSKKK